MDNPYYFENIDIEMINSGTYGIIFLMTNNNIKNILKLSIICDIPFKVNKLDTITNNEFNHEIELQNEIYTNSSKYFIKPLCPKIHYNNIYILMNMRSI